MTSPPTPDTKSTDGASHLASEFTPDDKHLLQMRAELKMLHRVAAFEARHPKGRKDAGGPNWTPEDMQVADWLKRHIFAMEPRLRFVTGRVKELTPLVGDHLRCRHCRQADVEVGPDDHSSHAGDW